MDNELKFRAFFVEMKIQFDDIFDDNINTFHQELADLLVKGWEIKIQQVIPKLPYPVLYVLVIPKV